MPFKDARPCCFETEMIVEEKDDINETGQWQLDPSKGKKMGAPRHNLGTTQRQSASQRMVLKPFSHKVNIQPAMSSLLYFKLKEAM